MDPLLNFLINGLSVMHLFNHAHFLGIEKTISLKNKWRIVNYYHYIKFVFYVVVILDYYCLV